jgi:hypothetical protein
MYDPFAANAGLTPRYLRMRQYAAERAQYQTPAHVPDPGVDDLRPVDAATADLRRRVAAASRPAWQSSLMVTGPMLAGLSLLLWQVVSNGL